MIRAAMSHERARRAASLQLDEPLDEVAASVLADHLDSCAPCRRWVDDVHELRQRMRLEPVSYVPDVAPAVRAALQRDRTRATQPSRPAAWHRAAFAQAAALFAVSVVAGAVLIGVAGPPPVAAADIGTRMFAVQTEVQSVTAAVSVIERGWHPDVPLRRYSGSLRYGAPESLDLRLHDLTSYPSSAWPANHVAFVSDAVETRSRALRPCPPALQPSCSQRDVEQVVGRAPFDPAGLAVSDLVLPLSSFPPVTPDRRLGRRDVDGRPAVGVAASVAQIDPLLRVLLAHGNWREVHPTDTARVWFDDETLVPLRLEVTPSTGVERTRWAAVHGYRGDAAGDAILEMTLSGVRVNETRPRVDTDAVPLDGNPVVVNERFIHEDVPAFLPTPAWLPAGMTPHRSGTQGSVAMATWFDGRAWLRVEATRSWRGTRLLGALGDVVQRVRTDRAGVVYVDGEGRAVGIHTPRLDVAVSGSVSQDALVAVAASLGVTGEVVPATWEESAVTTLQDAARQVPGLLVAEAPDGFQEPSVAVRGRAVTATYAGPGARGFTVTQAPGDDLTPPFDADVFGVLVRGREGRYVMDLGELEWVEGQHTVAIRSTTLSLAELLAIAETLRPLP